MQETKNTITEIKNSFKRLISSLNTGEERIFELEDLSIETTKTEKQKEKRLKIMEQIFLPGTVEQLQKVYNMHIMGITKREESEKRTEYI